jgi:hypothetical protein
MTTTLCILNLSANERPLAVDPTIVPTSTIHSPKDVPADDKLVLYIVGHGIQHGMVDATSGKIWDESELFAAIQSRRKCLPTVLAWDTCFAESVLHIGSQNVMAPASIVPAYANGWPANFLHVFSCLAFERTWHSGAKATEPSITSFSREFAKAVRDLQKETEGQFDWNALQIRLRHQYESIQRPRIVPLEGPSHDPGEQRDRAAGDPSGRRRLRPSDFDLGKLFAAPSKTANGSASKGAIATRTPTELNI